MGKAIWHTLVPAALDTRFENEDIAVNELIPVVVAVAVCGHNW